MNDTELSKLIEQLRAAAERLDCTLDVVLAPPASAEAIANATAAVGGPLPGSLLSFLRMHDGMRLFLKGKTAAVDDAILFPLLNIYGTDVIVCSKRAVPGMFDGGELSDSTVEKALRCVPIASVVPYGGDKIMFVRDSPQPQNEYAIVEGLDDQQIWLDALDADIEIITIANSFDGFVRFAIDNVLSGRLGFRYWNSKAVCVKYRGSSPDADESLF